MLPSTISNKDIAQAHNRSGSPERMSGDGRLPGTVSVGRNLPTSVYKGIARLNRYVAIAITSSSFGATIAFRSELNRELTCDIHFYWPLPFF